MAELSPKAQQGVAAIADMLGGETAEGLAGFARTDRFGAKLARLSLEFAYADNWDADDSLSRREKSLLLIAALVALDRPRELKNHVRLGLANGLKPEELETILVQLVPYVGFPTVSGASAAIRELLKEA
jgi:4-carboxymuconolactone decarboxylase